MNNLKSKDMNREIIFRGKRKDNGLWIYGSLINDSPKVGESPDRFRIVVISDTEPYNWYVVLPESVGQWTGLCDINNRSIYEGDIVKCSWLAELGVTEVDCESVGVVKWNNENPCFHLELIKKFSIGLGSEMQYQETHLPIFNNEYSENYSFEKIGRVVDNPELLNEA